MLIKAGASQIWEFGASACRYGQRSLACLYGAPGLCGQGRREPACMLDADMGPPDIGISAKSCRRLRRCGAGRASPGPSSGRAMPGADRCLGYDVGRLVAGVAALP